MDTYRQLYSITMFRTVELFMSSPEYAANLNHWMEATKQNALFQHFFDMLPSGLLLYTQDGRILRLNQAGRRILSMPEQESAPASLDALPDYLAPLRNALLSNACYPLYRAEIRILPPVEAITETSEPAENIIGYSLIPFHETETPPAADGNEPPYTYLAVFSDITTVVQERLALDRIRDELNHSRQLSSLGTLVAGVAHDLNNPLAGMSMNLLLAGMDLQALKQRLDALNLPDPERGKLVHLVHTIERRLGKITQSNEKAGQLVQDLYLYGQPAQLNLAALSIAGVVKDIVSTLREPPHFAQMQFLVQNTTQAAVLCDRIKLEQVFYNLFKNSSEVTQNRGTVALHYSETIYNDKPAVVIHVRDNGPGIDATIINRVFDPFFTTKGHSGFGLGLSISYRIIEQHGGSLSLETVTGRQHGTEFKITLPIQEEVARSWE